MVAVTIVLEFPLGHNSPIEFEMELPRIPQKGDWIGHTDSSFGELYNAFLEDVQWEFRLVMGCEPQYVQSVGYTNGQYKVTVSCNPHNFILCWNSLKDNKLCLFESTSRPQIGDYLVDDRNTPVRIVKVYLTGKNCFFLEVSDEAQQESHDTNQVQYEMANSLEQIAGDTRDIAQRVEDIYYQNR